MGRVYLSAEQLAAVTPWSIEAIATMVRRKQLVCGVHWFQPGGPRGARVFKWAAIVAFIETGRTVDAPASGPEEEEQVARTVSRLLALQ